MAKNNEGSREHEIGNLGARNTKNYNRDQEVAGNRKIEQRKSSGSKRKNQKGAMRNGKGARKIATKEQEAKR